MSVNFSENIKNNKWWHLALLIILPVCIYIQSVKFDYTNFERAFYLPENIQQDKIEASAENGVLKIVILKAEVKPPVIVTIK